MRHNITIGEVMTRSPYTIGEDIPLEQAKQVLYQNGIRHLPVLRGGKIIGVLSDRDVKLAYAVDGARAATLPASDVTQPDPYTVRDSATLQEVAAAMADRGIGSAVVTDAAERVVGIFTTVDACRVLAKILTSDK